MQSGVKVFARDAPQITVNNCSFENLKYTDSFFPILYKHSKLCKYDAGAISVQMVSTNNNSISTGYLTDKTEHLCGKHGCARNICYWKSKELCKSKRQHNRFDFREEL